jgi:hypothetical protein
LAHRIPTACPTVLVLSLPRSGSSWIAGVLGNATTALYLREPLTQSREPVGGGQETVFAIDDAHPPQPAYARAARYAFAGFPRFPRTIVLAPRQWALHRRSRSRLVVKEVNPFACEWLVAEFGPRVILLVRHPAAIAESYRRQGWVRDDGDSWHRLGDRFGRALGAALTSLQGHGDYRVAAYEALCADPLGGFPLLFQFAGLPWSERDADFVRRSARVSPESSGEGLQRRSRELIDGWRSQLPAALLAELERGYRAHDLPWYRSAADWKAAPPARLREG